jgi:hypothetical protein
MYINSKGKVFMKKKTRNLSLTLAVIAFVLFNLQLFILTLIVGDPIFLSIESLNGIVFTLAIAFIFSKNEVLVKVGYGFTILTAISYFSYIFTSDILTLIFGILIFVLLLISTLTWFVSSVLNYFGYIKGDDEVLNNQLSIMLAKIKDLLKKQIITSADYASIKNLLIGPDFTSIQRSDLFEKIVLLEKGLIEIGDLKKASPSKASV